MTGFRWDPDKSRRLELERGVSFEEIIQEERVAVRTHPSRPGQRLMLFQRDGYIWVVPYVRQGEEVFLKTLFRSRKYTKMWRRGELG